MWLHESSYFRSDMFSESCHFLHGGNDFNSIPRPTRPSAVPYKDGRWLGWEINSDCTETARF